MALLQSDGDGASYASLAPIAYGYERNPASETGSVNALSPESQYDVLDSSNGPSSDEALDEDDVSRIGHEIVELESRVKGLRDNYYIVDVLGSGTFSSVYKAIDLRNSQYDNEEWIESYARSMASGALPAYMSHAMDKDQSGTGTTQPRYLRASDVYRRTGRPVYVALKRIFVTSSPARILNELDILVALRDGPNVSHLITAWRSQDQVMVVMPLVRHEDFRHFHRILPMSEMRYYFHSLLTALQWCHSQDVIHRDVKPTNFLYNPTTATGTLCDFGLAEIFDPNSWQGACHHGPPTLDHPHGLTGVNSETESTHFWPNAMLHANSRTPTAENKIGGYPAQTFQHLHANIAVSHGGLPIPGYIKKETRPSVHAERAGTRGFRPPEVLLKCPDQTVAIDIWAVGVIMLAFLTKRYPLFNARDDQEALLEISTIFGKRRMEQVAVLHNRTFITNVPTVEKSYTTNIPDFIRLLNPYLEDTSDVPNPEEHLRLVGDAIELARNCLQLDCTRRWTAERLIQSHPFFEGLE